MEISEKIKVIEDDVSNNSGLMKDAWIVYKGEKWYPVLVKDRRTGVVGFEINFSGDWGSNDKVGREKKPLMFLLEHIANKTFPEKAAIRCKRASDVQRNARHLKDIQLSLRLSDVVADYRRIQSVVTPDSPHVNAESSVQNIKDRLNPQGVVSSDDQNGLESDTEKLNTEERKAVVKVRFGQGAFRSALLAIAGDSCWMSGLKGKELLIASHIQPWAHCEKNIEARGCPENGLLLSSLWDAAFDKGLVSFDADWRVVISSELSSSARRHLGLDEIRYLPSEFRTFKRAQYLVYHKSVVFRQ